MTTVLNGLQPEALYRSCRPDDFTFATTAELDGSVEIPGQERAAEAVQFGLGIDRDGYNIFALGPAGAGKQFLANRLRDRKRPAIVQAATIVLCGPSRRSRRR
jgi:predicted ATPase with chaperone activity